MSLADATAGIYAHVYAQSAAPLVRLVDRRGLNDQDWRYGPLSLGKSEDSLLSHLVYTVY